MAAEDTDAPLIGTHRMIYAANVPHYYVERPDFIFYRTEQMIHGVTAKPGDRFILSHQRRDIQEKGPFDIHFMITRQRVGWTRETVVFRSGDPSPYPVEEKTVVCEPVSTVDDDETIRQIVIRSNEPVNILEEEDDTRSTSSFRIRTEFAGDIIEKDNIRVPSYWDEVNDTEFEDLEMESFEESFEDPLEEVEEIELR